LREFSKPIPVAEIRLEAEEVRQRWGDAGGRVAAEPSAKRPKALAETLRRGVKRRRIGAEESVDMLVLC
jgi:hypothetical protein